MKIINIRAIKRSEVNSLSNNKFKDYMSDLTFNDGDHNEVQMVEREYISTVEVEMNRDLMERLEKQTTEFHDEDCEEYIWNLMCFEFFTELFDYMTANKITHIINE